MPDFNAHADVHVLMMRNPGDRRPLPPIHSGTLGDCIKWTLANHDGYPETYSIEVPLEAGFQTTKLHYRDIEALAQDPQFPK